MGTSQSSKGPGAGVAMVPPWADAPPQPDAVPATTPDGDESEGDAEPRTAAPPVAPPLAPSGRFSTASRNLTTFARSGDAGAMRRGMGHYVRDGYGGSGLATRRMSRAANTTSALGEALANLAEGRAAAPGSPLDPALLAGRSADEIIEAAMEALRPVDGSQDAEAERVAIHDALSELLKRFPQADLLGLTPDQREFAIQRCAAANVYQRFILDLGQRVIDRAPSVVTGLARLKEVKSYVFSTVAAAFQKLKAAGRTAHAGRMNRVVREAIRETFVVFEGYSE